MLSRKFVLANKIIGTPKLTDFKLVEEELPLELQNGELLLKAEIWTVDPYMRGHCINNMKVGDQFEGAQVARVLKSRNQEFPEGSLVIAYVGWRDLTIFKPSSEIHRGWKSIMKIPDLKGLPDSYALGCCGMPGNTAYFGLNVICTPKAGETVVVSAAAGSVGSLVGQIAKIQGCNVIGFAGSDDKVQWLIEELGFNHAFNYKTVNVSAVLAQAAPEGVDCYFDSVAGEFAYDVIQHMRPFGRISQCGSISEYNDVVDSKPMVYFDFRSFRLKSLRMEGFNSGRWAPRWLEGIYQLRDWILEGKLKVHETITFGFENMPQAFIELLEGKNTGKQIIKA